MFSKRKTNVPSTSQLGYNFSIKSNVVTKLKYHQNDLEKEYLRSKLITEVHQRFDMECKRLFFFRFTPKDSLNRILLEQLSLPKNELIPRHVLDLDTLDKEIKNVFCLTCKIDSKTVRIRLRKIIKECIYFAKQMLQNDYFQLIEKNNLSDLLELYDTLTDAELEQIFLVKRAAYENLLRSKIDSRLMYLKQVMFNELTKLSFDLKKIKEENCTSEKVSIELGDNVVVSYKEKQFELNYFHFNKLKDLFLLNEFFDEYLFVLLSRYQTFFRHNQQINEGYGMQASLPKNVFTQLYRLFGVTHEAFASPFNCYFRNYCSAFADIDCLFGSSGSFFDYEPIEGSFEANPPFTEEVIERMSIHIENLLNNSARPLSFVVFIPEWVDPPTPGLVNMEKSTFLRKMVSVEKNKHKYICGSQYVDRLNSYLYNAGHNTRIFILQNDAGNKEWPVDDTKMDFLIKAME
ncbi:phosphorylated CTD-interacting factor 1 [Brachionus plicatilis]|uniref:Phosphorylated CTD-interacting factor 1 n=1 Tax=Brachionus plicatilis TaxID=10195 RepID=A0A3M7T9Q5_BRAPC|nr:phosphorylated CTD-interacting factor 1 [Brachionus plicatilis]